MSDASSHAQASGCQVHSFGVLPDGRRVESITLRNRRGVAATFLTYGATLQSLIAPDRDGRLADIALGYATMGSYLATRDFMGATVGRYANRIAGARFTLAGRTFATTANEAGNTLHGGEYGLDKVLWTLAAARDDGLPRITLRYVSADGEEGFPGALAVTAACSLDELNQLTIEYGATTDRPTIVNITGHAYFNLAGEGSPAGAMGHLLTIASEEYTPVNAALIPTGELRAVAGTPFDFRRPTPIGSRIREMRDEQIAIGRGYDHNWVVSRNRAAQACTVARLEDPVSGRVLELMSDQPGLQFYSGNVLDGRLAGKSGRAYRQGDAVVLEPQLFPDTPNRPHFGSARLDPGERYVNRITYRLSI